MRRATCVAVVVAGVVALSATPAAPAPGGPGARVAIGFGDYSPATLDVLAGETVQWSNESVRNHTVTADGGAFDSGTLAVGGGFMRMFDQTGSFPYHCRLHPSIRGEVDVHEILLEPPAQAAQGGQPFPIAGRAALPPGTPVSIEGDDGAGGDFRAVAGTAVEPGGTFSASVTPQGSARYRAVAGAAESPSIQLVVLNHEITASVRHGRRTSVVAGRVTPADPGATVVLQLQLRERFGWWPVALAKLGASSQASFRLPVPRTVRARLVLTLPDGATPLAVSPPFRLRQAAFVAVRPSPA
jgi:plastocyanin